MSEYTKTIFDCSTGEQTVVQLTDEEIAEMQAAQAKAEADRAAFLAEQAAKQAAKDSAIAKLAALGLTEEEAAAIVGV